jgi:drug/metabolite transporter (DMT)-like permease
MGVRAAGDSLAYTNAMFLLWSLSMPILYFLMRKKIPRYTTRQTVIGLLGGIISIAAYGIVIWAMQYDAMGMVSALRETSVIFAALLGKVFLKEKLTLRRVTSCLVIVIGGLLLSLNS